MKTKITITKAAGGYIINVQGRFGGGHRGFVASPEEAAERAKDARARFLDTNPEGGDIEGPDEVLELLNVVTDTESVRGSRLSYYANGAAMRAIQAERESTGASVSAAITALVLRGSRVGLT